MFSLTYTVQSRILKSCTSGSALLPCVYGANDGKLASLFSVEVLLRKKTMYEQFVRSIGRIYCKHGVLKAVLHSDISDVETSKKLAAYRFMMETGDLLMAVVHKNESGVYRLHVEVQSTQGADKLQELIMVSGLFREDSKTLLPRGSGHSYSDGAYSSIIETPLARKSAGRLSAELTFQEDLAPFYVSISLKSQLGSSLSTIRSNRKTNFVVPVGFGSGSPSPLGISFLDDGSVNLAFISSNVEGLVLCLYADEKIDKPTIEIDLDPYVNRTGDIWHALIYDWMPFARYGFRCRRGTDSQDSRATLDPYSKFIDDRGTGLHIECLGRLYKDPPFDWSGETRPDLRMEELIIYKLNVTRFTKDSSSNLPGDISGTFLGISEKLHHIMDLGVNALLLEPVFPFDSEKGVYFPQHFFSPANLYAPSKDPNAVAKSMKEMVKKAHANGVEVLLEVVFTHTSDSGALREMSDSSEDLKLRNTLNCNDPVILEMILESLRYWVTEFHIDGFCFMNASALLKGVDGESLQRPPLIEAISFDPLLAKVEIIADFWDPRDMETKETLFPHWKRWAEMNPKFCMDVRSFLKGESPLSNLATRLCGSGDLFLQGRGPAFSFNYITRNAGLTLIDLVSFSNSDLEPELSWNCGEEGATSKAVVLETRLKQIRNFLFILFASLGVPVVNMGDEFGESCAGSPLYSNRKPLNWNLLKSSFSLEIRQFISFLSSLKKRRSDLLQRSSFMEEEKIEWRGAQQSPPNWDDSSCKFLAVILKGGSSTPSHQSLGGDLFMAFNSGNQMEKVAVPQPASGERWVRLVNTALPFPGFFEADGIPLEAGEVVYEMRSHSCVLFESRRLI